MVLDHDDGLRVKRPSGISVVPARTRGATKGPPRTLLPMGPPIKKPHLAAGARSLNLTNEVGTLSHGFRVPNERACGYRSIRLPLFQIIGLEISARTRTRQQQQQQHRAGQSKQKQKLATTTKKKTSSSSMDIVCVCRVLAHNQTMCTHSTRFVCTHRETRVHCVSVKLKEITKGRKEDIRGASGEKKYSDRI